MDVPVDGCAGGWMDEWIDRSIDRERSARTSRRRARSGSSHGTHQPSRHQASPAPTPKVKALRRECPSGVVVAVVGLAHMDGIEREWLAQDDLRRVSS